MLRVVYFTLVYDSYLVNNTANAFIVHVYHPDSMQWRSERAMYIGFYRKIMHS